jgi:hypothetical protein
MPIHTTTLRRIVAVLACGATLVGVSACGSSNSKSKTSATAPVAASTPTSPAVSSTPTAASSTPTSTSPTSTGSSGAGATAPSAYVNQVKGLVAKFQQSVASFQTAGQAASSAKSYSGLATALDGLASSTDRFASGLSKLSPPANGANFQSTAVTVLHQMASTIRKTSTAVAHKDQAGATTDEQALAQELSHLTSVEAQLTSGR